MAPVLEPDPTAELREPLVIRPTSETIIWDTYRRWISTHRDLPLLLNQWANVVRWEMRTRPFLRTSEFLWQEGHTAHASEAEAQAETARMAGVYRSFIEGCLAVPVVLGCKSSAERFAGAVDTLTCEAMMQNGWALQAATSHFLGQNFAKAFDVKFADEKGVRDWVWATSWGASTRLIGATIMSHSDDTGLVLPPAVAPTQVVVLPLITKQAADKEPALLAAAEAVAARLQGKPVASPSPSAAAAAPADAAAGSVTNTAAAPTAAVDRFAAWLPPPSFPPVRVAVDADLRTPPGSRFFAWERAGVPLRLEIGPRDLDAGTVSARTRVPVPLPVAGLEVAAPAAASASGAPTAAAPAAAAAAASSGAGAGAGVAAAAAPTAAAGPAAAPFVGERFSFTGDRFTLRADASLPAAVAALLAAVQRQLFANALARTASNVLPVASADEVYAVAAEHAAGAAQADLHDHDDAAVAAGSSAPAAAAANAAPAAPPSADASAGKAASSAAGGKGGKSGGKGGKGNAATSATTQAQLQPLRPHPWIIAPLADDPAVDTALKERKLTVRCFPAALPEADSASLPVIAAGATVGVAPATSSVSSARAVIDDDSSHRTWAAVLAAALSRPDASPAAVAAVRDGLAGRGRCIVTGRDGCRVAIIGRAF